MIAYNGGKIGNIIINQNLNRIYVTDTINRAIRYANTQATGEVDANMDQEQAEGTIILIIECEPNFHRRPDNHSTLDTCEAIVSDFTIIKAIVRFRNYDNTLYGTRHTGYYNKQQVVEFLENKNIQVEIT